MNDKERTIGYLSGTFDLFHIGHLNIIRRAREHCDYLIVGVHPTAAFKGRQAVIPFSDRVEIIRALRYVDEVVTANDEDTDDWNALHFDKLFVGDDYVGSERFARYEAFFRDKNVEIVYFPYTRSISSTLIREAIKEDRPLTDLSGK